MCIHSKCFTEELCQDCNIEKLTDTDGYVYCEIRKVMYGLKEAGCIDCQNFVKNLTPFGYEPMQCHNHIPNPDNKIHLQEPSTSYVPDLENSIVRKSRALKALRIFTGPSDQDYGATRYDVPHSH